MVLLILIAFGCLIDVICRAATYAFHVYTVYRCMTESVLCEALTDSWRHSAYPEEMAPFSLHKYVFCSSHFAQIGFSTLGRCVPLLIGLLTPGSLS